MIDGKRMPGSLDKAAGVRCKHQRRTGCNIYNNKFPWSEPKMPMCCQLWNCRWLVNDDTADLSRPDRSHYVIDIVPDFSTIVDNDTGERTEVEVIQVWIDPKYPDAHRDPALRRYIDRQRKMAIVRYNSNDAIHLCPPSLASDGQWHELDGKSENREHSVEEIQEALARMK